MSSGAFTVETATAIPALGSSQLFLAHSVRCATSHEHQAEGACVGGKINTHSLAVVNETVDELRDLEPMPLVEAHGAVTAAGE